MVGSIQTTIDLSLRNMKQKIAFGDEYVGRNKSKKVLVKIKTILCPIIFNSNTIELTIHTAAV